MTEKSAKELKNYIGGKWVGSEGSLIKDLNPADTSEVLAMVPDSTKAEVDSAVRAAREAYPKWRLTPAPMRGEILYRAAELLKENKEELAVLVTREMGKIIAEGGSDVQEAIDIAYYMAGEGRRLTGETMPSELPSKDCKTFREPVGVFALITPWNFPTAIPAWKIFPALISGDTVVFKPSSYTPAAAARVVEILAEAGLPAGVVNLIHGGGDTVGEYLATHAGLDGISFTGSSAVGEKLARLCTAPGKVVSCEMGGKNPIIVMGDANLDLALEGALWGAFGTTGQRCTAASRLIVHKDVYERFLEMLVSAASKLVVGDGLRPETDVGPMINEAQLSKALSYVRIGREEGATLALGGKALTGDEHKKGFFMEPTIFRDVTPSMRIATEEIFGPFVSVLKAESLEDAIEIANNVEYGLSSAIYTRDVNASAKAERDLTAGIVYINAPTIGAEVHLPFGGTGRSGLGHKEAGGRGGAIEMFSRLKVVYRDYSGALQKAQID
ncbi:MAG: aldehyde dehydrogenase family protein [Thermodesulfobacteriota bacterium]